MASVSRCAPRMAVIVSMVDGLESFVKREVDQLFCRGYHLRLFATKYKYSPGFEPDPAIHFFKPSVKKVLIGAVAWGVKKPSLLGRLFLEALRLNGLVELLLALSWARQIQKEEIQLIHCAFGDRKYFVGYFLKRLTGLPLTVAIHAHEIYAQPNPPLFLQALCHTSGIVTISDKNKQLLYEKYGIDPVRINVIRLSVDLEFWRLQPQTINVLTVARFTPRKGWHELIRAAQLLGPGFHFYGVGFGELDVEALAQQAGVGERFTVFPKLRADHLRLLMQACDIFCLPSKPTAEEGSEGIPVVLMEAMAMDMPIVTTNDGSISELVDEEIMTSGDAGALAEALRRSAARLPAKAVASEQSRGRSKVAALHGPDNILQLDAFFRQVIKP